MERTPNLYYFPGVYSRDLQFPSRGSSFLFGPRQVGKSTLVHSWMSEQDFYLNLLPERTYFAHARDPGLFRQEVLAHVAAHPQALIVVDEVQRIPGLLNEAHDLIEAKGLRFLLTGSSGRKLRRGGANLLGGRARMRHLFPLLASELGSSFDLERALRVGVLPYLWANELTVAEEREFLASYVDTYLREEIQAEGVVRAIAPFTRFLDIAAADDGAIVNFSTVARECGVSVKTAQSYYEILEDTFVALRVDPYLKSARRRLVAHPRYYLFDPGVTNALAGQLHGSLGPETRGRRFEQFIVTQLQASLSYLCAGVDLRFWRTHLGAEVDLLLCRGSSILAAVEIKSSERELRDLRGLRLFLEDHPRVPAFAVGPIERARQLDSVSVVPWRELFERLPKLVE